MKAYHCYMRGDPDVGGCIVFADNTSGAKKLYMATDLFDDSSQFYTEIRAKREPEFDGCYRGHSVMEWENPHDRADYEAHGWCLKAE